MRQIQERRSTRVAADGAEEELARVSDATGSLRMLAGRQRLGGVIGLTDPPKTPDNSEWAWRSAPTATPSRRPVPTTPSASGGRFFRARPDCAPPSTLHKRRPQPH